MEEDEWIAPMGECLGEARRCGGRRAQETAGEVRERHRSLTRKGRRSRWRLLAGRLSPVPSQAEGVKL